VVTESVLDSSDAGRAAVRGSVLRSSGYVAGLALSLVSAPLLIRHLGAVDFGRYLTVISLVTIVAGVTEGGLNSISLREYSARSGTDRVAAMRDLIGIRLVLSLAGGLLAVALAAAFGYPQALLLGTAVAVSGQMLQVFQTLLGTSLQGEMRFGWVTALEFVRQAATAGLIVVLVLAGASLLPFFFVPLAAGAMTLTATLRLTRGLIPLRPAFHLERWWPLLRDTLPFAAAIAISVLYFRVGMIAMSLLSSSVETGYFAASFRVIDVFVGIPALIAGTAFPILARSAAKRDEERLHYAAGRLIETTLVVGTFLSLSLVLGARPVIAVIGGAEFAQSVPVLQIQSIALIATSLALSAGFILLALHRNRAILVANGAALSVSVVLSITLIPILDARGAAVAVVLAEFTLAAFLLAMLARARGQMGRGLVSRRPLTIVAVGAVAATVALVPSLPAVGQVVLGEIVFSALLVVTGTFPPELRELVRRP